MTLKDCALCQHYRRVPSQPGFWNLECTVRSRDFPSAEDCASYTPPPMPGVAREASGLGYVWDGEWEGAA